MTQIPLSSRFRQSATRIRRSGAYVNGRYVQDESHTIGVGSVVDSTNYTVTINATPFVINSGVGATANSIVTALKAAIDLGAEPVTTSAIDPLTDTFLITNDASGQNSTVTVDANLTVATIEGVATAIFVNVQPPTDTKGHDFLLQLPESERSREVVVVYTFPKTLRTANEGSNIVADEVLFEGRTYKVQRLNYWPGQILTHDQAYCTRLDND
jgi:hypothetical protein